MQDKERGAQTRSVYEHTRGREHRSDAVLRFSSSIWTDSMKLLLIRNDNIGDLACTTPLFEALRKAYPEATIDLLGNSYNIDLVRNDPRLSRLWSYEKAKHVSGLGKKIVALVHKAIVLCRLRNVQYDVLIIAAPVFNKRTVRLARWIRPKKIYGAATSDNHGLLPANYHPVSIDPQAPHVLQVFSYARALGIKDPAPESMSLFLSAEEKKASTAEKALIPGSPDLPIIGLQLSARRPKQRWSYEQWKNLIATLLPHARLRLLWSPGSALSLQHPGDDQLAQQLAAAFSTVLAKPTTDLHSLMIAFSSCDLILGSDGGAMHIAAALDVATVTLFGDIDPTIWQPYSKKGLFIASPTDTLADLDPTAVAKKIIEIMNSSTYR